MTILIHVVSLRTESFLERPYCINSTMVYMKLQRGNKIITSRLYFVMPYNVSRQILSSSNFHSCGKNHVSGVVHCTDIRKLIRICQLCTCSSLSISLGYTNYTIVPT